MAHILRFFDLHPIFLIPIGQTAKAGSGRFLIFYLNSCDIVH